jgi:hypothetical protein
MCKNRRILSTSVKVEAKFMLQMSCKAKFDSFALTWAPGVVEDQNIHLHCNMPCQHLLSQLMCKHPFDCVMVLLFSQEEILSFFTTKFIRLLIKWDKIDQYATYVGFLFLTFVKKTFSHHYP